MKRVIAWSLCLCIVMSFFTFSVSAADEISTFGITMSGFKGGAKESDVTFSPDNTCNTAQILTFLWRAAGKPACSASLNFTDLNKPEHENYKEAIAWSVEQGITNGTSETTFSPGKTCTRGQIVTFLWRAAQKGLI